ncbi:hypothetical protein AB4Y76_16385 [Marmoricola sp. RAF53]
MAAVVAWVTLVAPTAARADDSAPREETSVAADTVTQEELQAAADRPTAGAREAEREFILDQAAQGILLDSADVDAAQVGDGKYAWSSNVEPRTVEVAHSAEGSDQTDTEIGTITELADDLATDEFPVMGSSALTSLSGVASSWGGCISASYGGNHLSSCWSLYRAKEPTYNPDRDFYYYGRYVTATGHQRDAVVDEYPMLIDIRSRPTEGTSDRVLTARGYYPFTGASSCGSTSVGVTIAGFGATLPVSNCKSTTVTPNGKAIKVEFSAGNCHDSRSEGVDLGITFASDARKARPAYSDYNYARFSNNKFGPCDTQIADDDRVIFTDPGW